MEESVLEERLKEVKNLAASAVLLARAVIYKSKDVVSFNFKVKSRILKGFQLLLFLVYQKP